MTKTKLFKTGRSKNFTKDEIDLLLELVEERKTVIEDKRSDTASVHKKNASWDELTSAFNTRSGYAHRQHKILRKKYENLKKDLKTRAALQKRSLYSTGGGPSSKIASVESDEKLKSIVHGKQIHGLGSEFDNDYMSENGVKQEAVECVKKEFLEDGCDHNLKMRSGDEIVEVGQSDYFEPAKFKKLVHKKLQICGGRDKRTPWQRLADIKANWTQEKFFLEKNHMIELHQKRVRILELEEEKLKKSIKLVELEETKALIQIELLKKEAKQKNVN